MMRIRVSTTISVAFVLCGTLFAREDRYQFDPAWDYPILGVGLTAAGTGFLMERRIASRPFDPSGLRREDIPAYDRWALGFYSKPLSGISDALILADGLAPLALTGFDLHRRQESIREAWTDLVLYGEVVAYASAVSLYSKTSRLHPRPLAFTSNAPLSERESGDARSSFFSEHTTGAFAAAVFTAYTFQVHHPDSPWIPWMWSGAMGTAAGVGALRVFSGKHFPSDVLAGAIAGSAIGYLVPRLHLGRQTKPETGRASKAGLFHDFKMGMGLNSGDLSPMLLFHLNV
ncbi:MAG: phosphoesterase PA-phosphatase related protein [Fibrobacteres bacterium]|nr:phosphoesterase PA-phosphatase related protein [Fibrobacterota bacterium]